MDVISTVHRLSLNNFFFNYHRQTTPLLILNSYFINIFVENIFFYIFITSIIDKISVVKVNSRKLVCLIIKKGKSYSKIVMVNTI